MRYNPHRDLDPERWLALDEHERVAAVKEYHRRHRIRLPSDEAHAVIHTIVENQVALGDAYRAKSVLLRLMAEGLDRHEAIHAIGSALSEQLFDALKHRNQQTDFAAEYLKRLDKLTAESWRKLLD